MRTLTVHRTWHLVVVLYHSEGRTAAIPGLDGTAGLGWSPGAGEIAAPGERPLCAAVLEGSGQSDQRSSAERFDHVRGLAARGAPHPFSERDRAQGRDLFRGLEDVERRAVTDWIGEHLTEVRQSVFGQRILYWTLSVVFLVGLGADVGGYLIKSSTTTEPLALVGDLLYTLGWALWTGVVMAVLLQIIPEAKRGQYKRALDAYEATLREEATARSDEASPDPT